MQLPFQRHWLEDAIGAERDPAKIGQVIARNPQFLETIRQAIEFASKDQAVDQTRVIAEHIISQMSSSLKGCVTMH